MLVFKRGSSAPKSNPLNPSGAAKILVSVTELDRFFARCEYYCRVHIGGQEGRRAYEAGQKIVDLNERMLFYSTIIEAHHQNPKENWDGALGVLRRGVAYKWNPVTVEEFITSPKFLNKKDEIYPAVLEACCELNNGQYVEAVLTGGIGSGKTTLALYTNCYQLYLLSCMRNPHGAFGLDPSSEILFIFQSITKELAKGVDYQRFRDMIQKSPYFKENFPFESDLESQLVFPNRIIVKPVAGTETGAIGQNVIGGLIDELNYMAVVEKSKVAVDKGVFDQAVQVYNSIARRRKSRFVSQGKLPGILCLVSSKKYPGQFTDQKMEEARTDKSIYVYDKRVWEIKPDAYAGKEWFTVFVGDMTRKPRIMSEDELVADEDRHLVQRIPADYRTDFNNDIINALREIAGVSTLARHPFFLEVEKVNACFGNRENWGGQEIPQPSVFSQSPVDFASTRLTLVRKAFYKPELPRFCHIDLAISGDSAGMAIGTVAHFQDISDIAGRPAFMPVIRMDGILEIRPPKNGEIQIAKCRQILVALRKMGLNIRWVTFDQFQSVDSQQILRQQGFITGQQSIDVVPKPSANVGRAQPYDFMKAAAYEGRLLMPRHSHVQKEILMLEKDSKTGKIDHPPDGSKDCSDAVAGVVYGLTTRREVWALHNIPLLMIPENVMASTDKLKQGPVDQQDEREFTGYAAAGF